MTHRLRRGAWGALVATALATTAVALPTTAHADSTGPLIAYQSGGAIYVAHQDGSDPHPVAAVDANTLDQFGWAPDGGTVYYQGIGGVHRVGVDGLNDTLVAYTNAQANEQTGIPFAVDPSGNLLVTDSLPSTNPYGLNVVPADGSAPAQTAVLAPSSFSSPTFDPLNGQLVGTADRGIAALGADDQVQQIATSADLEAVIPEGFTNTTRVVISPDGTNLAIVADYQLYDAELTYTGSGSTATLTGISALRPLLPPGTTTGYPHWSSDSRDIISSVQGGQVANGVAGIPIDGGAPSLLPLPAAAWGADIQPIAGAAQPAPLQLTVPTPQRQPNPLPAAPPIGTHTNGMVAYTEAGSLVVATADDSQPHVLEVGEVSSLAWSPDGRRIYFTTPGPPGPSDTWVVKSVLPNGTDPVLVASTDVPFAPYTSVLAPDLTGRYLLHPSGYTGGGSNHLDLTPADGSAPTTTARPYDVSTALGDGQIDAITVDPVTNQPIIGEGTRVEAIGPNGQYVVLGDCGTAAPFATAACTTVQVSPDGTELAYLTSDSTSTRLMVATLAYAGSGATARVTGVAGPPVAVVTTTGSLSLDSWTPDGSAIVYSTSSDGQTHTIAPTGGTPVDLPAFTGDADVSYQPVGSDTPTAPNIALHGIDTTGTLWSYARTGKAAAPLAVRQDDYDWSNEFDWRWGSILVRAGDLSGDGRPDLLATTGTGALYLFEGTTDSQAPYTPPTQVGHGWQIYNQIIGVGDVTGDGKPDLIARDSTGELWLYQGNSNPTDPFTTRVQIGGGWNTYNQIIGAGDLTGDGHPDLITRDATGELWLYQGTGKATAPFATRVKIGGGWNTYNQIVATGDLTGDGHADLVARDTTGSLWLYQGTGTTTAPFATRTQIGHGWQVYNQLF